MEVGATPASTQERWLDQGSVFPAPWPARLDLRLFCQSRTGGETVRALPGRDPADRAPHEGTRERQSVRPSLVCSLPAPFTRPLTLYVALSRRGLLPDEKAIAHPTDSRLLERCREHLVKAAARHGLKLRQNYNREAPRLGLQIGRYAHAKQYKRMKKALRTLRSRVVRVMRDVERQVVQVADPSRAALMELIGRTKRIVAQKSKDKNKLYALHAPEVECLAKGNACKPYEFGMKVSITMTHKEGLVVGMRSTPGNPYDGHTMAEALEQAAILSDTTPEIAIVDRAVTRVSLLTA